LDLAGSGYRPVAGFCEHDNEPSGSKKKKKKKKEKLLFDKLSDHQVFKEYPAQWSE
jgi:hypothetical protein